MPFSDATSYDFKSTVWRSVGAVYGIINGQGAIVYVGETDDLKRRIEEHRADQNHCMHRHGASRVRVEVIADGKARLAREQQLIAEYRPPCNR